jgi:hypothetical protein
VSADEPAGVRYITEVTPQDVGARVSLRRRLPEGGLTDVLGHLESWSDGVVRVRDRHGVLHEVAATDVVAARRVPPAPPRRGRRP